MSNEEELGEIIRKGRVARERHEQEVKDFEVEWLRLRGSFLFGLFKDAERAFGAENISAEATIPNSSILLSVARNSPQEAYRYVFMLRPDKEKTIVLCSSTFDSPEPLTLNHLDPAAVWARIKLFTEKVVSPSTPPAATP